MTSASYAEATRILSERDPVLASLARRAGPVAFNRDPGSNFEALVRAIVYQQLAGAAAHAIYGRLLSSVGREMTPEALLARTSMELREVGLSTAKAKSVLDLAGKVTVGTVMVDGLHLDAVSDVDLEARLVSVRGIGPWTAEVFMMIHLGRMDVLPVGDLGIRKGLAAGWGLPVPTEKELRTFGDTYRPYRSVFAWYCWKALELHDGTRAIPLARESKTTRASHP